MGGAYLNPLFQLEYVVLSILLLVAAGGFLSWRTSGKASGRTRWVVTLARVIGLGLIAVLALNPGRWRVQTEDRQSEWAILLDRSLSMATMDVGEGSRWQEACRLAQKALGYSKDAARVKVYTFSDQLEPVTQAELVSQKADGKTTDILHSGVMALGMSRSTGKALKGMLLLSDGRQIAPASQEEFGVRARAQESPLYAVPIGGVVVARDLVVRSLRPHYVAYAGQKMKIGALVENNGMGAISPLVVLLDGAGKKIAEQSVSLTNGARTVVQFDVIPPERGTLEYGMAIAPWDVEDRKNNNEAAAVVTVLEDKMRVLVVEGLPYWDSKFLIQLLRKQPNTEVTSIYRLSSDRFFRVETDPSKATESEVPIFPDDRAALDVYDFVVLGRGVEYFLTPERISLLRGFVRERGGGILFARGKPYSAEFPELEGLEAVEWGETLDAQFRMKPTVAGENSGLFGEILPGTGDSLWARLPVLQNAQNVKKVKPFVNVLVEGTHDAAGKDISFPVVMSRRYGKGLIVTVNAEGLWQWDFFPAVSEASGIYHEFWIQLVQWLITYSEFLPGQEYSLRLSQDTVLPETPVRARIHRRFAVEGTATAPVLRILRDKGAAQELAVSKEVEGEGGWEAVLSMAEPGRYVLELGTIGNAKSPRAVLSVQPPPSETDTWSADPEYVKNVAESSGGRLVEEKDLAGLVAEWERPKASVDMSKAIWVPLWDRGWYLVLTVLFFGMEWFVRRRNGLM